MKVKYVRDVLYDYYYYFSELLMINCDNIIEHLV